MRIDSKLANLLSNFCLDIAKAYFIAAFITPSFANTPSPIDLIIVLTRGLADAILFLIFSYELARSI